MGQGAVRLDPRIQATAAQVAERDSVANMLIQRIGEMILQVFGVDTGYVALYDAPTRQAMIPSLVAREDLTNAIALNETMVRGKINNLIQTVAENMMRPVSRYFDEHEHEIPWDYINFMQMAMRATGRSNHQMLRLRSRSVKWQLLTPSTAPPSSVFLRAMACDLLSFITFLRDLLFSG